MRIYGTLGPACEGVEILEEMFRAGMTGQRLNLSHMSLYQAARQVENLHKAAERAGVKAELLIDMQGPELRVGGMEKPMKLEKGEIINAAGIPFPEIVLPRLKEGQEILLDDGRLLLKMINDSEAEVLRGGILQGRKSVALPGAEINPPTLTPQDLENIACAAQYGVTGLMQPFVRGREDLQAVRRALNEAGCGHVRLLAKIENMEGVKRLEELMDYADEIVIARGDLGNAMPLWELPCVQKDIAAMCRRHKKDFMVVTQMLYSMEKSPVPTRAEVSDIYNAVADGAASLMVTGETAVGSYPIEVIKYMKNTAESARKHLAY